MKTVKFNPAFLTDDELTASFCVRTEEFESIIEMIKDCKHASNPHRLIVGPRGSGKTTLLLRVAAEIRNDPELSRSFLPIVFAEESYSISSAGEFWLEALSRLAEQAPITNDRKELMATYQDLKTTLDDVTLGKRCLASIVEFSQRYNLRIVLIVENLNMIFSQLPDPDMEWELRHTLQIESKILLLASASSRFEEIDSPDRAFFDLFVTHTLQQLNSEQCAVLWNNITGQEREPEAMSGIRVLTGGSPRFVAILARFGAELSFSDLLFDLHSLVDDLTEYFRNHIESLPPQERRVYVALLTAWEPATARKAAELARIDTNRSSALLNRMVARGIVNVLVREPRRKLYYVSERLYNIYYLLRTSRSPHPLVEALIRFMDEYYTPSQLNILGAKMIQEISLPESDSINLHIEAFKKLILLPKLDQFLDESYFQLKKNLPRKIRKETDLSIITTMTDRLVSKFDAGDFNEALSISNKIIRKFGDSVGSDLHSFAAKGFLYNLWALDKLGDYERLLESSERTNKVFSSLEDDLSRYLKKRSIAMKFLALANLNQFPDSLSDLDEFLEIIDSDKLVDRLDKTEHQELQNSISVLLVEKGKMLLKDNEFSEAILVFNQVISQYDDYSSRETLKPLFEATINKAVALFHLDNFEEIVTTCDNILYIPNVHEIDSVQNQVAYGMALKGVALFCTEQTSKAEATLTHVISLFRDYDDRSIRHSVLTALLCLTTIYAIRGDNKLVVNTTTTLIEKYDEIPNLTCHAFLFRASAYLNSANIPHAEQDVKTILSLLPDSDQSLGMATSVLTKFATIRGLEHLLELVSNSPSSNLLRPLTVAIEKELGGTPIVAKEIEEVAEDIRQNIREQLTAARQQ